MPRKPLAPRHTGESSGSANHMSEWISVEKPEAGGFGPLLVGALATLGIREDPEYEARHLIKDGRSMWEVRVRIPASPRVPDDDYWTVRLYGADMMETITLAAHEALTELTEYYHQDMARPYGYFPVRDQTQDSWRQMVENLSDPEHATYDPDRAVLVDYSTAMFNLYEQSDVHKQKMAADLRAVQRQLKEQQDRTVHLEGTNQHLRTRVAGLQVTASTLTGVVEARDATVDELQQEVTQLQTTNEGLVEQLHNAMAEINDLEYELEQHEPPEPVEPEEFDSDASMIDSEAE